MDNLVLIAEKFSAGSKVEDIREFGKGNINSTYLVTTDSKKCNHFILQSLNTRVFRQPELVMKNMRITTVYMLRRLQHTSWDEEFRWEVPRVLFTRAGADHWRSPDGSFWRGISFIESSRSFSTIKNIDHAKEVGGGLGMFHALLSDLPAENLADTLPGFHITPLYLSHYDSVLSNHSMRKSPEMSYCMDFINKRRSLVHILEDARSKGQLKTQPIHGDPKVNNVMIDRETGKAVSIVDLDTVKPGLIHYDIGDCLRSGCNTLGEELTKWETVYFETDLCKAILQGYLSIAGKSFSENDFYYLYDSIRLLAFELGLRFFTDYLEDNTYFKVSYPEHNLARALVQFKLTESIEIQDLTIKKIIQDIR